MKLPLGVNLKNIYWKGKFPGKARKNSPYVKKWTQPKEIQKKFERFKHDKVKLRLLITETPINVNVYVSSFQINYSGGYGDYDYSIQLLQAKDLIIRQSSVKITSSSTSSDVSASPTETENTAPHSPTTTPQYTPSSQFNSHGGKPIAVDFSDYNNKNSSQTENSMTRPSLPAVTSYTVKHGDCLWAIAEKYMGSGSKYLELYNANISTIKEWAKKYHSNEKFIIYPGQVLSIPN